jgi:hypothetical protein
MARHHSSFATVWIIATLEARLAPGAMMGRASLIHDSASMKHVSHEPLVQLILSSPVIDMLAVIAGVSASTYVIIIVGCAIMVTMR